MLRLGALSYHRPHCCYYVFGNVQAVSADKDTVVVTDRELGKMLPNRNLGIGQEVQKGLTDEKMRGDFWI